MHSWPVPQIPSLPGSGNALRLYDSATAKVRPTAPGPRATMYVCGITPYDATHLGHAATYITFDLVNRVWRDAGHEVVYVQNVTDVDDPLLERAVQNRDDWRALAERETEVFRDDMAALRVIPPTHYLGAVESIPAIVQTITDLRSRDATYRVDGDLYFSIAHDSRFGEVSRLDRPTMIELFAERGGDPNRPGKRDPLDPLLWQSARKAEPAWQTDLGWGRPGWHVECASIAAEYLGTPIDLQGGGRDLIFPHHDMTSAMAIVGEGAWPFARHNVHAAIVGYDGHKMSKSRGNLVFVRDLRTAGHDPNAIRLALMAHHYRTDWDWSPADLTEAEACLGRWRAGADRPEGPPADVVLASVRDCLSDDLNTAGAVEAMDQWVDDALAGLGRDRGAPGLIRSVADTLLGIELG